MSNIDTVKAMYEAFGRGDVPSILEKLDDNVEWDTDYTDAAAPWLEPRRGKGNIPAFFEAVATMGITKFDPHTILGEGNKVVAVVDIEADHKGKHYVIPNEGHLWTFGADGKVTSFQHMTDTALHWKLANGQ
jgi:ketosteroid isomerase-like protein